jgi:DNA-binding NtrC family response regulator
VARARVLVVDDERDMLDVCRQILQKLPNTELEFEHDSTKAAERLGRETFDLLVTDVRMPGIGGLDLMRAARERDPHVALLVFTAFPSVDLAVEAMKLGAADFLTKPFLPEDLLRVATRLLEERRLRDENRLLARQVGREYVFDEIVGRSPLMQAVFETIRRVAPTEADVLIVGETGTGKELVARSIHKNSRRQGGRFVPVDCGAIPDDLLESEFFGHERGAFTGAHARSLGLLEFAHKGTFFLDEVGELSPRLQAKLLRVLQERSIRRVGGREEIPVDVRVVAATSRKLSEEIEAGRFREDLYYRINVARIDLPPLRERAEDVPLLVERFLERHGPETGLEGLSVDGEALEVLERYAWPGNVRELQNVVRRVLTQSRDGRVSADDLPDEVVAAAGEEGGGGGGFFQARAQRIASFEREYLANLLRGAAGEVARAAREARMPRGTLYRLLKKHNLDPDTFREEGSV